MLNFDQLAALVEHHTRPDGCGFYRSLYGTPPGQAHVLRSWEDWRALPHLNRERIIDTPIKDRCFIPYGDVEIITVSSGTSGRPPLFMPRAYVGDIVEAPAAPYFSGGMLSGSIRPFAHEHERALRALGKQQGVVVIDPQHPAASVRVAEQANADSLFGVSFVVSALCRAPEAKRIGGAIRYIMIVGETWTPEEFRLARAVFPNAKIMFIYGSRESSIMGHTEASEEFPSYEYAPSSHIYMEFIDEKGEVAEVKEGLEGELLITAPMGERPAFPFLRYRIGDLARVVRIREDGSFTFTLLGRSALEFLKIPGGQLRVDEIERVVAMYAGKLGGRFTMEYFEGEKRALLRVEALAEIDFTALARDIAARLHIGPKHTWAHGEAKGALGALECAPLTENAGIAKKKRMIRHPAGQN